MKMTDKRPGFSLIVVLIVSLIGTAIIGIAFYIYESSSGQTEIALVRAQEYNALVSAVEEGKNHLLTLVQGTAPVPRWYDTRPGQSTINGPDDLVINNGTLTINARVHGVSTQITVTIFDANYDAGIVRTDITGKTLADMPAVHRFVGGGMMQELKPDEPGKDSSSVGTSVNVGVYLIRARMTINGTVKTMETSVVQRNSL